MTIPAEPEPLRPERIVSGGQTGVDRGALDAALALGIPHGGWCPHGRLAEDGPIPDRYTLVETDSPDYRERTERNVLDSQGTLILYQGPLRGGTKLTAELAKKYRRACLIVDLDEPLPASEVRNWLRATRLGVLNVAGPRESQSPGITALAQQYLVRLFGP